MYDMFRVRRLDVGDIGAQSDIWMSSHVPNVRSPKEERGKPTQKLLIYRVKLFNKPTREDQIIYPIRSPWYNRIQRRLGEVGPIVRTCTSSLSGFDA